MMALWVIPGCALEDGRGWRIWLSQEGSADFAPGQITITDTSGSPQPMTTDWSLQAPLPGLDRRIGEVTVSLKVPNPGATYTINFVDHAQTLRLRSLPNNLRQPVTFLFSSCFYRPTDPEGRYLAGVRAVPETWKPAFKLLLGDQLYCDWPPERDVFNVLIRRAFAVYGYRYKTYWEDERYRDLMRVSPNYFMCEDHEYWNDYPETSWRITRSWPGYRAAFQEAADAYYQAFQASNNPGAGRWYSFDVGPVSFFVADARSEREVLGSSVPRLLSDKQWHDLESWGKDLRGPGILGLGQPLLQRPGEKGGRTLSNFANEYDRLWRVLESAARGEGSDGRPHDILVLGGDIHTSRYCEASRDGLTVREFISSPASKICPDRTEPDLPPDQITIGEGDNARTWTVRQLEKPTLDYTVGLVRMSAGSQGEVTMELGLWRIRPYTLTTRFQEYLRCLGKPLTPGPFQFLFTRTIQLR